MFHSFKFNASKCVADFNHQCNMYFANFKYANSNIRNVLFHKYCTAFCGSQALRIFNSCMEEISLVGGEELIFQQNHWG